MADAALTPRVARWRGPRVTVVTLVRAITAVVLLGGYEALARSGLLFNGVVPPLPAIARALIGLVLSKALYPNLAVTAFEVLSGFGLGALAGVAVGLSFGLWRFVGRVFDPWIHYLAPTPKIIFLPVFVLLFGVETGSKIAICAISAFFPVAVATFAAMLLVRPVLLRVTESFGATRWQTVRLVYIPWLAAPVLQSMRLGLGAAIIGALLAEIKMSRAGLGYLIIQAYNFFHIAEMYALLIIVFAIAWAANVGMEALARKAAGG